MCMVTAWAPPQVHLWCIWDDFWTSCIPPLRIPSLSSCMSPTNKPPSWHQRPLWQHLKSQFHRPYMCVEKCVGLGLRDPLPSHEKEAPKNVLHMVGRDPNTIVCVAKASLCFDIFINTVWALSFHSADVVAVWMCSAVVDLSRSPPRPVFLPATRAVAGTEPRGGLRLRAPRRLPSPQKWCQDNGGMKAFRTARHQLRKLKATLRPDLCNSPTQTCEVPSVSFKDPCCHSICLRSATCNHSAGGSRSASRRTLNSASVWF